MEGERPTDGRGKIPLDYTCIDDKLFIYTWNTVNKEEMIGPFRGIKPKEKVSSEYWSGFPDFNAYFITLHICWLQVAHGVLWCFHWPSHDSPDKACGCTGNGWHMKGLSKDQRKDDSRHP